MSSQTGSVDVLLHHARALRLFREAGLRIDSADLFYSRFKSGQNAMLGYLFSGRDESGAPVVLPGYVRTLSDGDARALVDKWERKKIRPTPLGRGVRALPDGQSVLVLFPHDGELDALPQVSSLAKLKRLLVGLPLVGGDQGRISEESSRIETIRYKPERRWVASADLRVRHTNGYRRKLRAFLRLFPDDRGARIHRLVQALRDQGLGDRVPRPLGTLEDGRLYLEETVVGEQLLPCIHRGVDCAASLAEALHGLHAAATGAADVPASEDFMDRARGIAAVLSAADESFRAAAEDVIAGMEAMRPRSQPSCLIHGDFHPEQVLVTDTGPVFVDLERAACGDPFADLGSFSARVLALADASPFGRGALTPFLNRFLDAYGGARERPQSDLVFFVLFGLLDCALLPLRRRAPAWRAQVGSLLRRAKELVARPEGLSDGGGTGCALGYDVAYPRSLGSWAGYRVGDDDNVGYGVIQPETGVFTPVHPEQDPALPHLADWIGRGELVSYRVGRRAVVRDRGGDYVKIVVPKRARRFARRYRRIESMLALLGDGAPRVPLLQNPDGAGGVLRFSPVSAPSLHQLLMTPKGLVQKQLAMTARALAVFHGCSAASVDLPAHGPPDEPEQWLDILARGAPALADDYRRVARRLAPIPAFDGAACLLHGDLHDKNILVDRPRIWLIDLDGACCGDPARDLGNLSAHLILRALQMGRPIDVAQQHVALLGRAYRESGGTLRVPAVRAWTAHTLFRLACLYVFRRQWRYLSKPILDEVSRWSDVA